MGTKYVCTYKRENKTIPLPLVCKCLMSKFGFTKICN